MSALGLGLLSGGLDSILAHLVLRRAGVEVAALCFSTPFFGPAAAQTAARAQGLELSVIELGDDYLEMVRNPPHGHGNNMNPCIDCHGFMLRRAMELVEQRGASFVFSGEVLGQRPMSQNRQALNLVAKLSGRPELVLRPLSAKLLEPTLVEEQGLVDREKLLDISGRGRKRQMDLAVELGLGDYPNPAGGCLLTEPGFSRRLADLWKHDPAAGSDQVELLKLGRHLRLSPEAKLVVGRRHQENQDLARLAPPNALRLSAVGVPGPLGLYFGPVQGQELSLAAAVVAGYSKAPAGQTAAVQVAGGPALLVKPLGRRQVHSLLL